MHPYLNPLVSSFRQHTDPEIAEPMAKYMKNLFPFVGIKRPLRNELQKKFFQQSSLPEISDIPQIIDDLWNLPEREFQYFGMDLLVKIRKKLPADSIEVFEKMIVQKSWWDTVDMIAGKLVSIHFEKFPELIEKYIAKWRKSDNIWLRRSCLLFQLRYKEKTNVKLLFTLINENLNSKEFFINKAIGWALREYSKPSPFRRG